MLKAERFINSGSLLNDMRVGAIDASGGLYNAVSKAGYGLNLHRVEGRLDLRRGLPLQEVSSAKLPEQFDGARVVKDPKKIADDTKIYHSMPFFIDYLVMRRVKEEKDSQLVVAVEEPSPTPKDRALSHQDPRERREALRDALEYYAKQSKKEKGIEEDIGSSLDKAA